MRTNILTVCGNIKKYNESFLVSEKCRFGQCYTWFRHKFIRSLERPLMPMAIDTCLVQILLFFPFCLRLAPHQIQSSYLFLCLEIPKILEEFWFRGELWWFQEMKQAKQLLHSILQWCSCEQYFVFLEMEKNRRLRRLKNTKVFWDFSLKHITLALLSLSVKLWE